MLTYFKFTKKFIKKYAFEKLHFDTWLNHLYITIDSHFKGENEEKMKKNALNKATVIQVKFSQY